MEDNKEILIEVNKQVVNIESPVNVFDITQDSHKSIDVSQGEKEVVEVQPTYQIVQPQITNITKSWDVVNIDKAGQDYYYIQSRLEGEEQYKIQRIKRADYSITWWFGTTNEWLNRETITYE